jgi:hypothetical protein
MTHVLHAAIAKGRIVRLLHHAGITGHDRTVQKVAVYAPRLVTIYASLHRICPLWWSDYASRALLAVVVVLGVVIAAVVVTRVVAAAVVVVMTVAVVGGHLTLSAESQNIPLKSFRLDTNTTVYSSAVPPCSTRTPCTQLAKSHTLPLKNNPAGQLRVLTSRPFLQKLNSV